MTDSEIVKARETCQSILAALGSKQIAAKAAVAEIAAEASATSCDAQVSGGSARDRALEMETLDGPDYIAKAAELDGPDHVRLHPSGADAARKARYVLSARLFDCVHLPEKIFSREPGKR